MKKIIIIFVMLAVCASTYGLVYSQLLDRSDIEFEQMRTARVR